MAIVLDVNMDEFVVLANKLEKISKKAFPAAVRGTLNSLAFDVKTKTMPDQVDKTFTKRQKNFFKANSRVEMARGESVDGMSSKVGFQPLRGTNLAVDNLDQQNRGGVIKSRSFIPTKEARTSKSSKRVVSRKNRISHIRNVVKVKDIKSRNYRGTTVAIKTEKERFVVAVHVAGKGGYVLSKNALFRVDKAPKTRGRFKLTMIYSFKKNRSVRVHGTYFMRVATEKTTKKVPEFYIKEAERQFAKYM